MTIGNFGTIHKVVKYRLAVRGPDRKLGSLIWYIFFDYIHTLYSRFFNTIKLKRILIPHIIQATEAAQSKYLLYSILIQFK